MYILWNIKAIGKIYNCLTIRSFVSVHISIIANEERMPFFPPNSDVINKEEWSTTTKTRKWRQYWIFTWKEQEHNWNFPAISNLFNNTKSFQNKKTKHDKNERRQFWITAHNNREVICSVWVRLLVYSSKWTKAALHTGQFNWFMFSCRVCSSDSCSLLFGGKLCDLWFPKTRDCGTNVLGMLYYSRTSQPAL